MEAIPIILIVVVAIVALIFGVLGARKRREELGALAARTGLRFDPEEDYSYDERYGFLGKLSQGDNRYAFNILSGNFRGHDVLAFDYHYQTYSYNSKGGRQTHHHYFSFFILRLPRSFPEITVGREGWFSKIAQAFGYDDIDFESAEFSRSFCVRSRDKRLAYDVCNPQMIEYLLANADLTLEIEENVLALAFEARLDAAAIELNLNRLVSVRALFPEYLFNQPTTS
jgi:hypothetical protein